jgi:6-phosphogluconolactonase (cycloisomerase 2 family)
MKSEFVFVQTNEADENKVIAFEREGGRRAAVATGGRGDGIPHLTSQGSVVLASGGEHLLVANAGSNDISVLTTGATPELVAVVPSGGAAPKSIAEHDGLVYVLNTGDASVSGFTLSGGKLAAVPGSRRELGPGSDPAQVGFAPDGSALVVTDRGSNAILVHPVDADGLLGEPTATMSAGPTPYGFTFAAGGTLVVTEAFGAAKGKAAASSYRLHGSTVEPVTESLGNGRSEICWAVASADGRHVFTTNFADGAVSRYEVAMDGTLALVDAVAGTAVEGQPGLRDEDLSGDGKFLYALDADAGRIFAWRVEEGSLEPAGSWNGLPATVAGLAAS